MPPSTMKLAPVTKPEARIALAEGIQGIAKADSPPKAAAHLVGGHTGIIGHGRRLEGELEALVGGGEAE